MSELRAESNKLKQFQDCLITQQKDWFGTLTRFIVVGNFSKIGGWQKDMLKTVCFLPLIKTSQRDNIHSKKVYVLTIS